MKTLRPYQQDLKNGIYESWNAGNRNVLGVLQTGGGKSFLFADIIRDHVNINQKFAAIAHRNELVSQISCEVAEAGVEHRIIGASTAISQITARHRELFGRSFINPSCPSAVIGVDTFIARQESLTNWAKQVDLWVNDESHHNIGRGYPHPDTGEMVWEVQPNKWGKAVHMFTNARGLGVTATPQRADGQGLGRHADGVFDDMITGPSLRWLIDNEYLADYEIACPISDFHVDENKRGKDGDYTNAEMRKASKQSKIVGDVVENYMKFALGRKAIVFATDVETATEMANKFNAFGIRAVCLHGKSNPAFREQSLKQFDRGEIDVLVNVDLFDEGFNVPSCEVCIMARPTMSLGKFLQMIGRVLRYVPGKVALIIDHVGNILRHKYPDYPRHWTLDRREKRAKQPVDPDEIPLTRCFNPSCNKPYEVFRTVCPHCGKEKPLPDPASRSIEMVEGDLILLDRETLARKRAAMELEAPADVGNRVSSATKNPLAGKGAANRQIEKIEAHGKLSDAIAQWAGIMRHRGYEDREIHKIFYALSGTDVLAVLDGSRTRKDFEASEQLVRSWYEG